MDTMLGSVRCPLAAQGMPLAPETGQSQPAYLGRFQPHGRTLGWRDSADGGYYFVYYRNHSSTGRLFKRIRAFTHGKLLAGRWDGLALLPVAEGPKLTGSIVDIVAAGPTGTRPETIYVALTDTEGVLRRRSTTRIVAYDL